MSLTPRLELKQTQRLSMTPQLRQAIKLLQLSNVELASLLESEVEKNPLLEFAAPPSDSARVRQNIPAHGIGQQGHADSFDFAQQIEQRPSLRAELATQIRLSERDHARAALACQLIDELDESGFLGQHIPEIASRLGKPATEIENALTLLQTCDPVGIGARDLRECLALQLRDKGQDTPVMLALIDHLDLLASGNFTRLASLLNVSQSGLEQAIATLQTLNPRPAADYVYDVVQTAVPDIFVTKSQDGTWNVELNTSTLPGVLVNESYTAEVAAGKTREYLAKCHADARFLLRAMDQRAKTILRVATRIVSHQSGFFESGLPLLRPLTLATIAAELDLHEATVSRVTRGKYLECPQGNFPLRFFFAGSIARANAQDPLAVPVVQERIRQMIARESAENVLSDAKIVKTLQDDGINIARRTVAKYRASMGIAPSSRRRRNLS